MSTAEVRTRFAPSPSGHLHVGGARTALFCWAWARQHGGAFVLRIEDTDQKRSSEAAAMAFLEDLLWLGIDWDEGPEFKGRGGGSVGPYHQSKRLHHYERAIDRLLAEGKAYRAFETPEELAAAREQARREKRAYRYDRAALELDDATVQRYLDEGRPHVVRCRVPDGEIVFQDLVRGEVRIEPGEVEDFVIRKADGWPTYHFAVVVDDEAMGISHVIRAQEHLYNTPKHVVLQDHLGYARPTYAHLSLIMNQDGSKMSKRDKDKALRTHVKAEGIESADAVDAERWDWWLSKKEHQLEHAEAEALARELGVHLPEINVDDFRRAGYLPEALCNYLALLGWSPGDDVERFDRAFLVERFGLDRIVRSPAKFDRDKLLAFNLDALAAQDEATFARGLRAHCTAYEPIFVERLDEAAFDLMAKAIHEGCRTYADKLPQCRFLVEDDDAVEYQRTKPVRKALGGEPSGLSHLERLRGVLADLPEWTLEAVEAVVRADADAHADGKLGKVAQPVRVAVSGGTVTPPLFEVLAILGRDATVARIDRCLAAREALTSAPA